MAERAGTPPRGPRLARSARTSLAGISLALFAASVLAGSVLAGSVLAGCELASFTLDGGPLALDASAADGGSVVPRRFAIGGIVVDEAANERVPGVEVCSESGTCVLTDERARWRIDGFAALEPDSVLATHPDFVPQRFPFEPTESRTNLNMRLLRWAAVAGALASVGAAVDPDRGVLSVLVSSEVNLRVAGVAGATVSLSVPAVGPGYPQPDGSLGFEATGLEGVALFGNVEVGEHVVTVDVEGRLCTEGLLWRGDAPNTFRVPIRAGEQTALYLICSEVAAIGEACSDERVCDGQDAACLVGPDGGRCVDAVSPCPDRPLCLDGALVNRCVAAQARGFDCAGLGATCDAAESSCVDLPRDGPCGPGLRCAEGDACVDGACTEGMRCADALACAGACAVGDRGCVSACEVGLLESSAELFGYLRACAEAAACPSVAGCAEACAVEHHACEADATP